MELISNYRAAAILSVFSKIIVKCFQQRLTKHLTKSDSLCSMQFGFCAGYYFDLAFLSFTDKVKQYNYAGKCAGAVFINLTIAFYSILHNILLDSVSALVVAGPALAFIHIYLTDRQQAVSTSNHISNFQFIDKQVPLGSMLGSLLFTISTSTV